MARQRKSGSAPKRTKRTNVASLLPRSPQPLYARCTAIWQAVKADTVHFTTPYPPAAQIEGDLTALGTALQTAEGGDSAAKAAVTPAAQKVRQDFRQLREYVQGVLQGLPPEEVPPILAAILLYESMVGIRAPKPPLAIKQGLSGSVILYALAILGALTYEWDLSADQGVTWTVFGKTGQAQITITGLTPGKVYYFRFNTFQRDGTSTEYVIAGPFMVK